MCGLIKCFGVLVVVDYVDLSVLCVVVYGFFGFNGLGKFIIICMLCGLLILLEGDIEVFGLCIFE